MSTTHTPAAGDPGDAGSSSSSSSSEEQQMWMLRGSAEWISKSLYYLVNSVLYYRELYPEEMFRNKLKHGSQVMILEHERVNVYIKKIFPQLYTWMSQDRLEKVVVPLIDRASGRVVERWLFDINVHAEARDKHLMGKRKPNTLVESELASFIQHISASVSWLPRHAPGTLTFKVLAFCKADTESVSGYRDQCGDYSIDHQAKTLTMKNIDTTVHKLQGYLAYQTPAAVDGDEDTVFVDNTTDIFASSLVKK